MKGRVLNKILSLACGLALMGGLSLSATAATGDVAINEKNFPDKVFREYLMQEYDTDGNQIFSQQERNAVTDISIYDDSLSSLVGIEYFPQLTGLSGGGFVTSIDTSKNTKLERLDWQGPLETLDISKNVQLEVLFLGGTSLKTLDVSHNTKLTCIQLTYASLTGIDISNNTALTRLDIHGNQLTSIDVSHNTALEELDVADNKLTSIDVSHNTALEKLYTSNNQLTNIDVSHNTALKTLHVFENQLTKLDISQNTKLISLFCERNQLTTLDISHNLELSDFNCSTNRLTGLNLAKNTKLSYVSLDYYVFQNIDKQISKTLSGAYFTVSLTLPRHQDEKGREWVDASRVDGLDPSLGYDWFCLSAEGTKLIFDRDEEMPEEYYSFRYRGFNCQNVMIIINPVTSKLSITTNPANQTVAQGKTASFTVAAQGEGLSYQWQYKLPGSDTWSNSGVTAARKAAFTFNVTDSSLSGRQYRCIVTDSAGVSLVSKAATLTVEGALAITKQPTSVTATVEDEVTFSVAATGTGVTYQWQYKNANATSWSNSGVTAAKTANFKFKVGTDSALNGRQYRCIVKDTNGKSVTSSAATLTVQPALKITKQPTSVTATVGDEVTFSVAATGTGVTYQWQYKNANATTWSNSGVTAAKTANFKFKVGSDSALNGRQYRCIVKDTNGKSVTSSAVTLTVQPALKITKQPTSVIATVGDEVTFSVAATGTGVTYQWQYKNANATTWSNSGVTAAKTANFKFKVGSDAALNGRQYRCIVKDTNGKSVTSSAASLTLVKPINITAQPISTIVKLGGTANFTVVAEGEDLTYQWQYKNNTSLNWSNSGISAAKTATLSFPVTDQSLNGRQYRCVVKDKYGNHKESESVTLKIGKTLEIKKQPESVSIQMSNVVRFTIGALGENLTYQWQRYDFDEWVDIDETAARTTTYYCYAYSSIREKKYRCIVTDATGDSVISNEVSVTVKIPLSITSQPTSQSVKQGETAIFTVKATGEDLKYYWEDREKRFDQDSQGGWTESRVYTSTMEFLVDSYEAEWLEFRCVITDKNGDRVESDIVGITIIGDKW